MSAVCPRCQSLWDCRSTEDACSPRREDRLCPSCYHTERREKAGAAIGEGLAAGDVNAAYATAKRWAGC